MKTRLCFKYHSNSITCNTQFQELTSTLLSLMLLNENNVFTISVPAPPPKHTVYIVLRLSIRLIPILILAPH